MAKEETKNIRGKNIKDLNSISKLEADIMQIVWSKKLISVREVHEIILKKEMKKKEHGFIPYTTIMSIMNALTEKGLLKQDKSTKTFLYSAKINKQELSKNIIKSVTEKLLDNSANALVSNFLSDDDNISLEGIKKLLKEID